MLGAVALQADDPKAAEVYFSRILETQPKSQFREQIRYLLGNAKFMAGSYDDAVTAYKKYLNEFPKGASIEDVKYRIALCALFAGKYQDATNQLQDYVAKHPSGSFLPDANYRLAVCKYAASLYDEVIADCKAWEKQFPRTRNSAKYSRSSATPAAQRSRVRRDPGLHPFLQDRHDRRSDELFAHRREQAPAETGRMGQSRGAFQRLVRDKPDNPMIISALYWIGKARAHEGKIDEAKELTADTIKKYIADPKRETVEQLITQLAQLCLQKKSVVAGGADPGSVAATSAQAGSTPPATTDPGAELNRLLASSANDDSATAKARIIFVKGELARLRRQPEEEEKPIGRLPRI